MHRQGDLVLGQLLVKAVLRGCQGEALRVQHIMGVVHTLACLCGYALRQ